MAQVTGSLEPVPSTSKEAYRQLFSLVPVEPNDSKSENPEKQQEKDVDREDANSKKQIISKQSGLGSSFKLLKKARPVKFREIPESELNAKLEERSLTQKKRIGKLFERVNRVYKQELNRHLDLQVGILLDDMKPPEQRFSRLVEQIASAKPKKSKPEQGKENVPMYRLPLEISSQALKEGEKIGAAMTSSLFEERNICKTWPNPKCHLNDIHRRVRWASKDSFLHAIKTQHSENLEAPPQFEDDGFITKFSFGTAFDFMDMEHKVPPAVSDIIPDRIPSKRLWAVNDAYTNIKMEAKNKESTVSRLYPNVKNEVLPTECLIQPSKVGRARLEELKKVTATVKEALKESLPTTYNDDEQVTDSSSGSDDDSDKESISNDAGVNLKYVPVESHPVSDWCKYRSDLSRRWSSMEVHLRRIDYFIALQQYILRNARKEKSGLELATNVPIRYQPLKFCPMRDASINIYHEDGSVTTEKCTPGSEMAVFNATNKLTRACLKSDPTMVCQRCLPLKSSVKRQIHEVDVFFEDISKGSPSHGCDCFDDDEQCPLCMGEIDQDTFEVMAPLRLTVDNVQALENGYQKGTCAKEEIPVSLLVEASFKSENWNKGYFPSPEKPKPKKFPDLGFPIHLQPIYICGRASARTRSMFSQAFGNEKHARDAGVSLQPSPCSIRSSCKVLLPHCKYRRGISSRNQLDPSVDVSSCSVLPGIDSSPKYLEAKIVREDDKNPADETRTKKQAQDQSNGVSKNPKRRKRRKKGRWGIKKRKKSNGSTLSSNKSSNPKNNRVYSGGTGKTTTRNGRYGGRGSSKGSEFQGGSSNSAGSSKNRRRSSMHSDANRPTTRKKAQRFDIDNIVIPYSVAAATRVEKLQYKEILTPTFRLVSRAELEEMARDESIALAKMAKRQKLSRPVPMESTDDSVYAMMHKKCELQEKMLFEAADKKTSRKMKRQDSKVDSGQSTPRAQDGTDGSECPKVETIENALAPLAGRKNRHSSGGSIVTAADAAAAVSAVKVPPPSRRRRNSSTRRDELEEPEFGWWEPRVFPLSDAEYALLDSD